MRVSRRGLLGFFMAAPAIVAAPSLMRVSTLPARLGTSWYRGYEILRFDMLYGVKEFSPCLATRISGYDPFSDFNEHYLRPQILKLAQQIDDDMLRLAA